MENQVYYIKHRQVKDNTEKEMIVYPCVFENYEDAKKAFLAISEDRGYKVRYTEDGYIMSAYFKTKHEVFNILTIEIFNYVKSYDDFMDFVQSYEDE